MGCLMMVTTWFCLGKRGLLAVAPTFSALEKRKKKGSDWILISIDLPFLFLHKQCHSYPIQAFLCISSIRFFGNLPGFGENNISQHPESLLNSAGSGC